MNAGCLLAVFGLASLPLAYVVNGWALSVLWGWFIAPVFDVPLLTVPVAIGIAIVAGYLTDRGYQGEDSRKTKTERQEAIFTSIAYSFGHPLLAVLVGWIVLQFV